jgi:hypothetical protein
MLIKNDGAHDGRSGVGDVPRATTTPGIDPWQNELQKPCGYRPVDTRIAVKFQLGRDEISSDE